ncbi:MAG TPA: toll/interleukin-1 receptor domain-containing protein [Solirubrobacteraceae bacterium]|jgi:hypothetical protein|nr:toll/interleukin-1 receptor domain-containing protein [Solirubrobacteraceae bacterium]
MESPGGQNSSVTADVFISYRREDALGAGRLSDWLIRHFGTGRVFIDVTGIGAGQDYPVVIGEAIRNCRVVVAVVTPRWRAELADAGDWVHRELREALSADRPIVPVLLDGAAELQRSELPPELAVLADKQALVVSDTDFGAGVGRLIEALRRFGAEPAIMEAFPEIPARARNEARAAWDTGLGPREARERLKATLGERGIRIRVSGEESGDLLLDGGSKAMTRLFGGIRGPKARLPVTGRLRIRDRSVSATIEVLLAEDWGPGVFSGLGDRYSGHFDEVLARLRRATE